MRYAGLIGMVLPLGVLSLIGCAPDNTIELRRQVEKLNDQLAETKRTIAARENTIAEQRKQLASARALTDDELQFLFTPQRIQIGRLSGGFNRDNQPGDDGVVVYLSPIDQHGDVVKAAGDIRIELFDLENADEPLLGTYLFSGRDAADLWYGAFGTLHYTLHCPWQADRTPRNPEITIRATFRDYLTERVMTAVTTRRVAPPPSQR